MTADDDDLPIFLPPFGLDEVPGFCDRLVAHLLEHEPEDEFSFEGVDGDAAQGVWILPMGGYDPGEDPTDGHGGYAQRASTWTEGVRRVLREGWGDPQRRTPRLVGEEQEPEGILDYLVVAVRMPEAELWDRGELFCALMTDWHGEPGTSMLRQILLVLPRDYALGSMSALVDEDDTVHELLMLGEQPLELRRRAWLMSAMFDEGEVPLRDTPVAASRFGLQARNGTTTVWIFTDDGRALLLLQDPSCAFATDAPAQFLEDHAELAGEGPEGRETALAEALETLVARLLGGVPDDLRDLVAARGENTGGEVAEQLLELRVLGGRPVPLISGVAWFDGAHWHVPGSLTEVGHQNGFGMDDFGFSTALRRPYRLGSAFSLDDFADPGTSRREQVEQVFAACPYDEQPRPGDDARLGYGIPRNAGLDELVDQVERASAAWWEQDPATVAWGDRTFSVGGRELSGRGDARTLSAIIATSEPWTADALEGWSQRLIDTMSARWGPASEMTVHDPDTGVVRRSPVTREMRATGLPTAPLWWVEGNAVLLLAGVPDPKADFGTQPVVIVLLARADAVLDVLHGTRRWELRHRTRVISELAAIAAVAPDSVAPEPVPMPAPSAVHPLAWDGPPLEGLDLVPDAVRGRLRAGDHWWVWHFTHDGRGLLLSYPVDGSLTAGFADQAELFAGVPDDLLSLVAGRDPAGLYEVVAGEVDGAATTLPAVHAVLWCDDLDWRASEGMLRRTRAALLAEDAPSPLAILHSEAIGVPQLQWVVRAGEPERRTADELADVRYASHVLDRPVDPAEAQRAIAALDTCHRRALTGSLNELLDVIVDSPGGRYLLDAALSNPVPRHRREIAGWLLQQRLDASVQLSFLTPVNVLLENPTLDGDDAPLLHRLLLAGATPGPGLTGSVSGVDPFDQLARRGLDPADREPLEAVLRAAYRGDARDAVEPVEPVEASGTPLVFTDLNLKLAVIDELMYQQGILEPRFSLTAFVQSYADRSIDLATEGAAPIPEVLAWFAQLPIDAALAAQVVRDLVVDAGNEIYQEIAPHWDGEDDAFDIGSWDDLDLLPHLESIDFISLTPDAATLRSLRERGLEIDD
ncbi:hypothetical protein ABFU82_27050 [Nocardioides sp. WV_118_6]